MGFLDKLIKIGVGVVKGVNKVAQTITGGKGPLAGIAQKITDWVNGVTGGGQGNNGDVQPPSTRPGSTLTPEQVEERRINAQARLFEQDVAQRDGQIDSLTANSTITSIAELVGDEYIVEVSPAIGASLGGFLNFVVAENWDTEESRTVIGGVRALFNLAAGQSGQPIEMDEASPPVPSRLPRSTVQWLQENWGNPNTGAFTSNFPAEMGEELNAHLREQFAYYFPDFDLSDWGDLNPQELLDLYLERSFDLYTERGIELERLKEIAGDTGESVEDYLAGIASGKRWFDDTGNFITSDRGIPEPWEWRSQSDIAHHLLQYIALRESFSQLERQTPLNNVSMLVTALEGLDGAPIDALARSGGIQREGEFGEEDARRLIMSRLRALNDEGNFALPITSANGISTLELARRWHGEVAARVPRIPGGDYTWSSFEDVDTIQLLERVEDRDIYKPPDLGLITLVASVFIEPVDWVVTGMDVIGDITKGNWGNAGVNTLLAIIPFTGGWMNDAARRVNFMVDPNDLDNLGNMPPRRGNRGGGGGSSGGFPPPGSSKPIVDRSGQISDVPHPNSLFMLRETATPLSLHNDIPVQVRQGDTVISDDVVKQITYETLGHSLDSHQLAALSGAYFADSFEITIRESAITIAAKGDSLQQWVVTINTKGETPFLYNHAFFLQPTVRGQGIGTQAMAVQVEAASRVGIKQIQAIGTRSSENIGFSWVIDMGFDAAIPSTVRNQLPSQFQSAQTFSQLYNIEGGRQWWVENGGNINVEFTLSLDSTSEETLRRRLSD